jgi:ADP-ribosylation factor-like protein 2
VFSWQGDVGGQKTLRTYWKNYFEKTDTLIWVVDATDRERIDDCRVELEGLLQEEVSNRAHQNRRLLTVVQRLMGASLLVFKNKSDVTGSMTEDEVREVGGCSKVFSAPADKSGPSAR